MSGLKGKIVLITGASSGIGRGTAVHFATFGCKLSLVARNLDHLKAVAEECKTSGAEEVFYASHDLATEAGCVASVQHFGGTNELNLITNFIIFFSLFYLGNYLSVVTLNVD